MKGNTFSTWGIQSYPHFVQRKWKTLKKTESRYSHALKTRVEFRFWEVKFKRSGGVFDRGGEDSWEYVCRRPSGGFPQSESL